MLSSLAIGFAKLGYPSWQFPTVLPNSSLKSRLPPSPIRIPCEDLKQILAFTGSLAFYCYVNESVGYHCDLQVPTLGVSPASELLISPSNKKRKDLGRPRGIRGFGTHSKTRIITVRRCERSQPSLSLEWEVAGWAALHPKDCWNTGGRRGSERPMAVWPQWQKNHVTLLEQFMANISLSRVCL